MRVQAGRGQDSSRTSFTNIAAAGAPLSLLLLLLPPTQHDNLVPTMTAHESVTFYASVILPAQLPPAARASRINRVLRMMGLEHAQHMLVRGHIFTPAPPSPKTHTYTCTCACHCN